jgi:hypothetical protein
MQRQQILDELAKPPSQEWLNDRLDWLEQHPKGKEQSQIIRGLLESRGSAKRAARVRAFIHEHPDSLESIENLLGIDSRDESRTVLERWLSLDPDNVAHWISRSLTIKRRFLVTENDIEQGFTWVNSHFNHERTPYVICGLLYHHPASSAHQLAVSWVSEHMTESSTAVVVRQLAETGLTDNSLISRYLQQNAANDEAQELLAWLIREAKIENLEELIEPWMRLPIEQRSGLVLAALLSIQPSESLQNMARQTIEQQCPDSTAVIEQIFDSPVSSKLKTWAQQWLLDKVRDCSKEGNKRDGHLNVYAPTLIDVAKRLNKKELLDIVPRNFWECEPALSRMVIRAFKEQRFIDQARKFAEQNPHALRSFMFMCSVVRQDLSALPWIKDWLEEAADSQQMLIGILAILVNDPSQQWALNQLRTWISGEVQLGWGSSAKSVAHRIQLRESLPVVATALEETL